MEQGNRIASFALLLAVVAGAPRYTFESGVMGWVAQDASGTRGCVAVQSSTGQHHGAGVRSLEMTLAINGSDPTTSRGEALAELAGPLDLHAATIKAWIYAPPGSSGPTDNPNGVQLFIKDSSYRSRYSTWRKVVPGEWFQVQLPVSGSGAGFVDAGFDPTKIVMVGVKFAAGGGSAAKYRGPIYVDDVEW